MFGSKNCGFKKSLRPKKIWIQKMWVQTNFGFKQNLDQKKNFWSKKLDLKKDLDPKKILCQKN